MPAKLVQIRRGTTSEHSVFTGRQGEITVDLDKDTVVVHDGTLQAGHPLARENMSNVIGTPNDFHINCLDCRSKPLKKRCNAAWLPE